MSYVTFASKEDEALLRGFERAHLGCMVNDFARSVLQLGYGARERYLPLIPKSSYMSDPDSVDEFAWSRRFETWINVGDDGFMLPQGQRSVWTMALNTAVASGSPFLNLAARIHGTCEVHGYVEGEHRAWLADIVQQGLDRHIFRSGSGWQEVIALLRSRDDGPVVMSYSVCDTFPSPWEAGWHLERGYTDEQLENDDWYDEWDALSGEEKWDFGVKWLRDRNPNYQVDMCPEKWERPFGPAPEWSFYDLENHLDELRRAG